MDCIKYSCSVSNTVVKDCIKYSCIVSNAAVMDFVKYSCAVLFQVLLYCIIQYNYAKSAVVGRWNFRRFWCSASGGVALPPACGSLHPQLQVQAVSLWGGRGG